MMIDTDSSPMTGSASDGTQLCQDSEQHRYEGGRRYHNNENVAYLLPDDVEEDDRLHAQHWGIKLAFGSNFDAPVQNDLEEGTNVLDSGCGPATWTLELASAYQNSKFYGIDISARFPDQIKPGNCEFMVHNILDELPFEKDYFGYIHQRLLIAGIKSVDWPKLLSNFRLVLKPGGWIELTELSYYTTQNAGPAAQLGNDLSIKVLLGTGLDPDLGSNLHKLLSSAGFTNIQKRSIDIPVNHGGKVGELFWQDFKEGLHAARPLFVKMCPKFQEPGAFEKYIEDYAEEAKANKYTVQWTRVIAQKPSDL
ncbi:S-adenosyl-L-methionine-dependent methyltransferase [Dichotomocladium elegans]|nr:S-adenosyl-L-methionine-dependent methyltransferase [Dichotomocladium elegans]